MRTMEELNRVCKEMFEPKEGDPELWDGISKLTDRQRSLILCELYGRYKAGTHAEWADFKDRVNSSMRSIPNA